MKQVSGKIKTILRNPWVMFLPCLLVYSIIVFLYPSQLSVGDEVRYIWYASNLSQGFYSPPPPNILIWNGPGYPLVLTPLVMLEFSTVIYTLLNAVFLYFSVVMLFLTLRRFVSFRTSLVATLFWATYLNIFATICFIISEPLTAMLVTLLMYFVVKAFLSPGKKYWIISGLLLGFLILTKIIFAYVVLVLLAGLVFLCLIKLKNKNYRKALAIVLIAFATTSPYLVYTYHLTGRVFYWGNSGGQQLYWMSTPYPDEYGDWMSPLLNFANDHLGREKNSCNLLKTRHQDDVSKVAQNNLLNLFEGTAQDDMFRKLAIRNIREHPAKYIANCCSNAGRMVFGFPFSYKNESPIPLITMPWNALLFVLMLFCLIPTIINWRKLAFSLRFILVLTAVYLYGSTLVSAYPRMFNVIVPALLLWIVVILRNTTRFNFRFREE